MKADKKQRLKNVIIIFAIVSILAAAIFVLFIPKKASVYESACDTTLNASCGTTGEVSKETTNVSPTTAPSETVNNTLVSVEANTTASNATTLVPEQHVKPMTFVPTELPQLQQPSGYALIALVLFGAFWGLCYLAADKVIR